MCAELPEVCLSLSDLMGCKLPDSSVHELLQARVGSGPLCPPPGLLLTQGSNLGLLQLMLVANPSLLSQTGTQLL